MRVRLLAAAALAALASAISPNAASAQSADAIIGQVSSAREGAMEGVVISAKKAGSIITVSVVSDDKGHYHFPANRLEPGAYTLTVRAVGYDLDGKPTAQG